MGDMNTKSTASKALKERFLLALKCNDYEEVQSILQSKKIDVDTVFEVQDDDMVLASYKQGTVCRTRLFSLKSGNVKKNKHH